LPEAAGKGVASALYDALERRAVTPGIGRQHVEAGAASLAFFWHKGFT
jgi:GNAT superfamily N-acetyltransferase